MVVLVRSIISWPVAGSNALFPAYNKAAVFDCFNVLTSNGEDAGINDLGATTGNHHRL